MQVIVSIENSFGRCVFSDSKITIIIWNNLYKSGFSLCIQCSDKLSFDKPYKTLINIRRITNVVLPTYILPRCRNEIPFLHIIMHDKIEIMNSFFYFFPRMPYLFSVFSLLFQFFFFIKMSFVMHVYIFSRIMIRFC